MATPNPVVDTPDLDEKPKSEAGWRATPHARLERLLRETGVPIGLLFNGTSLRLVYAPIRERIYVGKDAYGVLLYTASPDAEGTLGGLVEAAGRIDRYLQQAIDLGRLCANDPVCAHHTADNQEDDRLLLGAACHGCLLLSESSCEKRNDFLDRALVVPTVDSADAAFFGDDE